MSDFIELRNGVPFKLDSKTMRLDVRRNGEFEFGGPGCWLMNPAFGQFPYDDWEMVPPYPTNPFNDEIDPTVVAVLVKRSKRYRTALAARAFIKAKDLHEEAGSVGLRALFRSMGGIIIQPGGLTERDAERFPGRTARIHGPGDITLFFQDGDGQARRRELVALTIAVQELRWETYEDCYNHGPLDLSLGDARRDHLEAHLFAAMLLVPQEDAARAVDIAAAEKIGAELRVDPDTVQDAHQLWHEITHPEQPKA
ncbi:hypothetical protein IV500_05040 [Paeniglutamicibacter antarcticus]|uniref:Uncharacterized protein n=1 Tax=Arthrobacter terrae TaxID=2935737 RepID=A0A931CNU1_9MICC|nr:hypothetical protein [Arthrobacter terrae]MBG0738784.1 hypothetical protein [Arthrobacter terrae]